ncbi:hypothetical protein [Vibrio sp.]|uniref:hypothetical protein n=1 Tax=Vibrio sp. TaxID=678 RepID=UPI003D0DB448
MKASYLLTLLQQIPADCDPDVVTGEEWLPEQLIEAHFDRQTVMLHFDNAPEEIEGEEEGRGFVEHEMTLIRERFDQIISSGIPKQQQVELLLQLFLLAHEQTSADVIEQLELPLHLPLEDSA